MYDVTKKPVYRERAEKWWRVMKPRMTLREGGKYDPHWAKSPGVLWSALVPYDESLRKVFEANHDLAGWGGLAATPWYLSRFASNLHK